MLNSNEFIADVANVAVNTEVELTNTIDSVLKERIAHIKQQIESDLEKTGTCKLRSLDNILCSLWNSKKVNGCKCELLANIKNSYAMWKVMYEVGNNLGVFLVLHTDVQHTADIQKSQEMVDSLLDQRLVCVEEYNALYCTIESYQKELESKNNYINHVNEQAMIAQQNHSYDPFFFNNYIYPSYVNTVEQYNYLLYIFNGFVSHQQNVMLKINAINDAIVKIACDHINNVISKAFITDQFYVARDHMTQISGLKKLILLNKKISNAITEATDEATNETTSNVSDKTVYITLNGMDYNRNGNRIN